MTTPLASFEDFSRISVDLLTRVSCKDKSGTIDQAAVEEAADDATSEIYGILGIRYEVPLNSPVSLALTRACVTISIYNLALDNTTGQGLGEDWEIRYNNTIKNLKSIAAGDISLGVEDPAREGERRPVSVTSTPVVFTAEKLNLYTK